MPLPATNVMEVPPAADKVSLPVPPNIVIDEPPEDVKVELPPPPTIRIVETEGVLDSESLPLPATKVIEAPLTADSVSLPDSPEHSDGGTAEVWRSGSNYPHRLAAMSRCRQPAESNSCSRGRHRRSVAAVWQPV